MLQEERTFRYKLSDHSLPNGKFDDALFSALNQELSSIDKYLEIFLSANKFYERAASQLPEAIEILTNELPLNAFQIDANSIQDRIKHSTERKEVLDKDFSGKLSEIVSDLHILLNHVGLSPYNSSLLQSLEEKLEKPSFESLKESLALAEKLHVEQFGPNALIINKAVQDWSANLNGFFELANEREIVIRDIAKAQSEMGLSHHIATNSGLVKLVNNVSSRAVGLNELKVTIAEFCKKASLIVEKLFTANVISFCEASVLSSLLDQMCDEPKQETFDRIMDLSITHAIWSEFGNIHR